MKTLLIYTLCICILSSCSTSKHLQLHKDTNVYDCNGIPYNDTEKADFKENRKGFWLFMPLSLVGFAAFIIATKDVHDK